MEKIKSFEDLVCWQKGRAIRMEVSKLIKQFPVEEKFELISQMRRASRSVTHNLAEGYGRFHFKENIQFCRISRGSLYEIKDQLITALDEQYIDEKTFENLKKKVEEGIVILNGYINYLKKAGNSY
ncbi:four helix bundle protein [Salegentibacter holothuriorum]|uniref:Four helix bundle protein n=1 Tax=Salegentibacter holothuriorum TaxID=241145 RepID=A0A1T5C254_9FLAO|nr:four helix bundle protein [Salegentibacter holothuriorum]SKB53484.1 four helix bundle protein [Salegentibacter holothuriorum]